MSLTLEVEQRLTDCGLVEFFDDNRTTWKQAAENAYRFVQDNFPNGSTIRQDDVAKALRPILEVHEKFRNRRSADKLKQNYWVNHFADLVVDRCWDDLEAME